MTVKFCMLTLTNVVTVRGVSDRFNIVGISPYRPMHFNASRRHKFLCLHEDEVLVEGAVRQDLDVKSDVENCSID